MFDFRPRESLLRHGPRHLSDEELLCVLLRTGAAEGIQKLVRDLFERFGNLRTVFSASPEELKQVSGIGPTKAAVLSTVKELSLRLWETTDSKERKITSPADAYLQLCDLALEPQEVVSCLFLTTSQKVICRKEVFRGTISQSPGSPREILREALRNNAARFVVAHNHPSDSMEASLEDVAFTARLERAAEVVGVEMVDHLIIGKGGRYFSFAEEGLLKATPPRPENCEFSKLPEGQLLNDPCRYS